MASIVSRITGGGVDRVRLSDRRGAGDRGFEPRPLPRVVPAPAQRAQHRIVPSNKPQKQSLQIKVPSGSEEEEEVVIDLGAPVPPHAQPCRSKQPQVRQATSYTPNPRLYPGPEKKKKRGPKAEAGRRRRVCRGPPNPRLYRRPEPPAPPAAPSAPRPPPPASPRAPPLVTASRAALHLAQRRVARKKAPATYAPRAKHAPSPGVGMAESDTAPSELLAEFLSATLRRQYGAALECCRLILHYEPDNATARAFYPLLRHRLSSQRRAPHPPHPPQRDPECAAAESDDSCSDNSIPDLNMSMSERQSGDSSSGSIASLDFTSPRSQTNSNSGSSVDDNGNDADILQPEDLENDNALPTDSSDTAAADEKKVLSELRARFACSIK